jgi:Zn-dependent protease with chaperone function
MSDYPFPEYEGVRSIVTDLLLTIITCGLYGLYWQYKQMETLNGWLRRNDFSFGLWLLLSIITCGIFAVYYEYKMAKGINEIQEQNNMRLAGDLPLICLLLTIFGMGFVSLAIQQSEINKFYGATRD